MSTVGVRSAEIENLIKHFTLIPFPTPPLPFQTHTPDTLGLSWKFSRLSIKTKLMHRSNLESQLAADIIKIAE